MSANYLEGARSNLEEKALAYARMKVFNSYLKDDHIVTVSLNDNKDYTERFIKDLLGAAVTLLQEMTLIPLKPRESECTFRDK